MYVPAYNGFHTIVADQSKKTPRNVTRVLINLPARSLFTSLHEACVRGDEEEVQTLLAHPQVDVNERDARGRCPVHLAARWGHRAIVSLLLEGHAADTSASLSSNTSLLHYACSSGNLDLVSYLFDFAASSPSLSLAHTRNSKGFTPFTCAAKSGNLELCHFLLAHGATLDTLTFDGRDVLHVAAERGHLDVTKWLLECHSDAVNASGCNEQGQTLVHFACRSGNLEMVKYAIGVWRALHPAASPMQTVNASAHSPLFPATSSNNVALVKYLVETLGADVDELSVSNLTPLLNAAGAGCLSVVKYLAGKGADVRRVQGNIQRNIVHFACWSGNVALLAYLVENLGLREMAGQRDTMRNSALHYAALSGTVGTMQYLLEMPKPLPSLKASSLDEANHTPLHVACKEGNYDAVVYLLENHAVNASMQCNVGATPLIEAAMEHFYVDIVAAIAKRHPETICMPNFNGDTVLHFAAKTCYNKSFLLHLVTRLVDASLLDMANQEGWSALHFAARHGNVTAFSALLDHGADVQKLTKCGYSTLHLAAQGTSVETCRILVEEQHMDPNTTNTATDRTSPLHLAAGTLQLDNVRFLVEKGASVTAKDVYNSSPLHYACCNLIAGKEETQLAIVKYLLDHGGHQSLRLRANLPTSSLRHSAGNLVRRGTVFMSGLTPYDVARSHAVRCLLSHYDPSAKARDLLLPYDAISRFCVPRHCVGGGNYATVYKGLLHGTPVAVKKLKVGALVTDAIIDDFLFEVGIMAQVVHPNVALLLGACSQPPHLCLVMEFVPVTLHDRMSELGWGQMLTYAVGIARGMAWLHCRSPPVLHCDLKPDNILIANNTAKVADFGISRIASQMQRSVCYKATIPPEIERGEPATTLSDIYQFGLCLLAMYRRAEHCDGFHLKQLKLGLPSSSHLVRIMLKCCEEAPAARYASFGDIIEALEAFSGRTRGDEVFAYQEMEARSTMLSQLTDRREDGVANVCVGYVEDAIELGN